MSPMKVGLADYSPLIGEVLLDDDTSILILGIGNLGIIPNRSGGSYTLSFLHVPSLCYNFISMQELCKLSISLELT